VVIISIMYKIFIFWKFSFIINKLQQTILFRFIQANAYKIFV